MSHYPCMGTWGILSRVCRLRSFAPRVHAFYPQKHKSMSTYNYAPGAVHLDIRHSNINMSASSLAELVRSVRSNATNENTTRDAEDITPVDTSFFCTTRFTSDIIEKNLRQAIESASSKADACRRVMDLEPLGYVVLSNVTDERKAELINPFASPKFILCGDDFTKARNRRTKQ